MAKKVIIILILLSSLSCSSEITLKKLGDIEIKRDDSMSNALVLKDFYMIKVGPEIILVKKDTTTPDKSFVLNDPGFVVARAVYFGGQNNYFLLNKDESKACKINADKMVDSIKINSPKDWYIFIDKNFSEYYMKYRLRGSSYNFDNRTSYTKYKYRLDIVHDKDHVFIFNTNSYSTYRLPDITLESVNRFYGKLGYAYCIHGIIKKKHIVSSTYIPNLPQRPEFYLLSSLDKENNVRIDSSYLIKRLNYEMKIFRLCIFENRIFIFVQTKEDLKIYELCID